MNDISLNHTESFWMKTAGRDEMILCPWLYTENQLICYSFILEGYRVYCCYKYIDNMTIVVSTILKYEMFLCFGKFSRFNLGS